MAVKTLLLALLPVLAASAGQPSCSSGKVCLVEGEVEDGSLIQKRTQSAKAAKKAAKAGNPCITPSGTRATTGPTELGDFSTVSVSGNIQVKFQTSSSSSGSYTVNADQAVMEYVSVEVQGSTLSVQLNGGVCWTGVWTGYVVIVAVMAPAFPSTITVHEESDFVHVGGSESVSTLSVAATDEGDVELPGVSASTCIFQAQDEADIEGATCNELQVTASDEATIKVHLTGSATGSLSDEATLKTTGGGSTSGVTTTGEARVKNKR